VMLVLLSAGYQVGDSKTPASGVVNAV
jgi:hypothetical protein